MNNKAFLFILVMMGFFLTQPYEAPLWGRITGAVLIFGGVIGMMILTIWRKE